MEIIAISILGLACIGMMYFVSKALKAGERDRLLALSYKERMARMEVTLKKVLEVEVKNRNNVEKFIKSLDAVKFNDDWDKLLDEAFGRFERTDPNSTKP